MHAIAVMQLFPGKALATAAISQFPWSGRSTIMVKRFLLLVKVLAMSTVTNFDAFDRGMTPWFNSFSVDEAKKLAKFQLDNELNERITELFKKSNEGELSEAESVEYAEYIRATNLIGILKSKARRLLPVTSI